jgi:hypothetical protein
MKHKIVIPAQLVPEHIIPERIIERDIPVRRLKIVSLHKEGLTNRQIAERMNIPLSIVSTGIYLARRDNLIPPSKKSSPSRSVIYMIKKLGRKYADLGRMLDVFDTLTKDEAIWLVTTLPENMKMSHYLASFVQRCICRGAGGKMKYSVMVEVDIGEWMYASADNPFTYNSERIVFDTKQKPKTTQRFGKQDEW